MKNEVVYDKKKNSTNPPSLISSLPSQRQVSSNLTDISSSTDLNSPA